MPGYGVDNLLLFVGVFFKKFGDALAFYDGLVQFLGCLGLYFLLLHFGFSWLASTICALLLGFNAYYPAYGTDPQLGIVIYFMPWVILIWDKFIFQADHTVLKLWFGSLLALLLAALFVASTIQQYAFVVTLVMIPYALASSIGTLVPPWRPCRGTIPLGNREIVRVLAWVALVFGVNLLLVLFELWPTLQTIQLGNRIVDSWLSTLFWVAGTVTLAVLALNTVITSERQPAKYARNFSGVRGTAGPVGRFIPSSPDFFKSFEETGLAVFQRPTAIFNRPPSYILTPLQTALVAYGIFKASRTAPAAVILFALGVAMLLIGSHTRWFPFLHETLWSDQEDIGRVDFVSIVGLMVGLALAIDGLKSPPGEGEVPAALWRDPGCPAAGRFLPVSEQELFYRAFSVCSA